MASEQTVADVVGESTCPVCGRRWNSRSGADRVICPACDARAAEQAAAQARAERDAAWRRACPFIYRQTDAARFDPADLEAVLSWQPGPEGLLLLGPTGTGKTRLTWLLLRQLHRAGARFGAFDAVSFGHEVGRRFFDGSGERWALGLARLPVVFLDDLGKCRLTERGEAELFGLVERRTANGLPVIATTNLTGRDLAAQASPNRGEPLVRRLREFCRVIMLTHPPRPAVSGPASDAAAT